MYLPKDLKKYTTSKIYQLSKYLIRLIVIPLTYILWIFEPFIKIRIHRGQISRIGHLALYFEILIRTKEVNLLDKKELNIFIVNKKPANKTLYNLRKRSLFFIESRFLDLIYHLCQTALIGRKHFGPLRVSQGVLIYDLPSVCFNQKEMLYGKELLKNMGVSTTDWFVCVHNRSDSFLNKKTEKKVHNYFRNCKLENFYEATKLINKLGGKSIRMSSGEQYSLRKNIQQYIIDYAVNWQNDFMDIYLPSQCKFFLGSDSGLANVAKIFNIPIGLTNLYVVGQIDVPKNSLFIPKLIYSKDKKRNLSYKEIYELNLKGITDPNIFYKLNLEVIENDPDDIKLLTKDMFDLINNIRLNKEQNNIRKLFMERYFHARPFNTSTNKTVGLENSGNISWRFLKKHSYLMH